MTGTGLAEIAPWVNDSGRGADRGRAIDLDQTAPVIPLAPQRSPRVMRRYADRLLAVLRAVSGTVKRGGGRRGLSRSNAI